MKNTDRSLENPTSLRATKGVVAWLEKSAICHSREGGNPEKYLK